MNNDIPDEIHRLLREKLKEKYPDRRGEPWISGELSSKFLNKIILANLTGDLRGKLRKPSDYSKIRKPSDYVKNIGPLDEEHWKIEPISDGEIAHEATIDPYFVEPEDEHMSDVSDDEIAQALATAAAGTGPEGAQVVGPAFDTASTTNSHDNAEETLDHSHQQLPPSLQDFAPELFEEAIDVGDRVTVKDVINTNHTNLPVGLSGVVKGIDEDGTAWVKFRESEVGIKLQDFWKLSVDKASSPHFAVGQDVEVLRSDMSWSAGKVEKIEDGHVTIVGEFGTKPIPAGLVSTQIRLQKGETAPHAGKRAISVASSAAAERQRFQIGSKVDVKLSGTWCSGAVVEVNLAGDGHAVTYGVQCDVADHGSTITTECDESSLRPQEPAASTAVRSVTSVSTATFPVVKPTPRGKPEATVKPKVSEPRTPLRSRSPRRPASSERKTRYGAPNQSPPPFNFWPQQPPPSKRPAAAPLCRYARGCKQFKCAYAHPDGREVDEDPTKGMCKWGNACKRQGCFFAHPDGRQRTEGCYFCREVGHKQHECPNRGSKGKRPIGAPPAKRPAVTRRGVLARLRSRSQIFQKSKQSTRR